MKICIFRAALMLAALSACTTTAQNASEPTVLATSAPETTSLAGDYRDRSSFEMFHGMRLHEDGTFEWAISAGAMDRRSSGTWEMVGGVAELTTTPTPVAPVFEQVEPESGDDGPFLLVTWPNGNGIAGINFDLQCEDGKRISHYTQVDGWDLGPSECAQPVSISIEESIYNVGPAYFDIAGGTDRLRFVLRPNDMGVEDMTGALVRPTETGISIWWHLQTMEMDRVGGN